MVAVKNLAEEMQRRELKDMDRLTKNELGKTTGAVMCTYTAEQCNDSCMYGMCKWNKKALLKLKEYEDTGLEASEITTTMENLLKVQYSLAEQLDAYTKAEGKGLLITLPNIKLYKTLYWIWGGEIMPVKYMGIHHGCVDKFKKYHIVCQIKTKKDKTFSHGKKSFTYKTGDERYFYAEQISKTVFLTQAEAEQALQKGTTPS